MPDTFFRLFAILILLCLYHVQRTTGCLSSPPQIGNTIPKIFPAGSYQGDAVAWKMVSCRGDYLGLIPRCFGKLGGFAASPLAAVVSVILSLVLFGIALPGLQQAEVETNIEKLCK